MPRREKPRGYNKSAHSDHPGVTISEEWRADGTRDGRKVLMLRWREPLARGKLGKRRGEVVKDKTGRLVTSRSEARPYAVAKSEALIIQRIELANEDSSGQNYSPEATWEELAAAHAKHLRHKGRRAKSREGYKQSWRFLKRWKARPAKPRELTEHDLERFAAFVGSRRNKRTGKRLSPASVASILAHVKVRLGFGRRRMKCVRVEPESMREALAPPKQSLQPKALHADKLRQILEAASEYDDAHPASTTFPMHPAANTFPLLAFFMATGCRRGEAEAVRWKLSEPGAPESWVDFEGDRLLIYSHKTSRDRVLPFETRPMLRKLLRFLHDQADTKAEPFVFGGAAPLAINNRTEQHEQGVKARSMKRALRAVRQNSGADWALKDLRSTTATHLCNADLYRGNTYNVASEMGHRHDVLLTRYAKPFALPKDRAKAASVEGALGIADAIAAWLKARTGKEGRVIKMGRA